MAETSSHWAIIRPVRRQIYGAIGLSFISSTASVGFLFLLSETLIALAQHQSWQWFAIGAAACSFVALFARRAAFNQSHYASFRLERLLRTELSERVAFAPLGIMQELGSGAVAKILQEDVRNLHIFVADSTPLYARVYAVPLLVFLALLALNPFFAFVLLGFSVAGWLVLGWVLNNLHRPELTQQYHLSQERVSNKIIEFMRTMPAIRAFGETEYAQRQYRQLLTAQSDFLTQWYQLAGSSAKLAMLWLNPLTTLLLILWVGVLFLPYDFFTLTQWQAVLLLGTGMVETLMPYVSLFHLIDKAKLSIERIQRLRQIEPLPQAAEPQTPVRYDVDFRHVTFTYPARQSRALDHLNFHLPQGSFSLVVGQSGSGKSTLLRLLLRFWDPTQGSICIGGVDLRRIATTDLMSMMSVMQQENVLFSGTVRENLCLGLAEIDDDTLVNAAKTAQIHDFIQTLPQGYDSPINERGNNFSGGQIQRLAIARAILQNRPMILLDEPTAYFDYDTERKLIHAIGQLAQHKTVIMVAHRLSFAEQADQILYLEQGKLAEFGSHHALLRQQGKYAALWQAYQQARAWRY
ncbi:ABC transporter ATP-binding protein [Aggregatibacter kilianii]|uniref:ABC transporter ATP-binding protein n=1 Tax=Aggregatibacter kilianii TaxID=2025884 RepID=UPI000D654A35|nr:ABC transporter ATP-binding protein [Aggregatibacter kilianii]RDE86855.1 ABC transporter ATP-binding protein [Aggregatibacter aphrophilus]